MSKNPKIRRLSLPHLFPLGVALLLLAVVQPQVSHAQSASGFLGGAAEALLRSMDEEDKQKRQKELLELQYKQQKELMEYQFKLESERRQREIQEQQRQLDDLKRQRLAAEEQKRKEEAEQRRNATSTGTGFFVAPGGYLVTNHHVIEDKSNFAVRDSKGYFYKAILVADDAGKDLALLKIDAFYPPLRIVDPSTVSKGQRVVAVGYPQTSIQGNESKVTDGVISSFSGFQNDQNWFQISVPIQGGNSGGPLATEQGNVVGVVVATANVAKFYKMTGNIPQNVNYAIKSNVLLDFLKSQRLQDLVSVPQKGGIEKVDASTVMVIAKNSMIDVNYAASPEQKARDEREKVEAAAAEKKRSKENAESEKRSQALAAAEEARLAKEQKLADKRAIEERAQLERRDREVSKVFPSWKETINEDLFLAWIDAQTPDKKERLNSAKSAEVIAIFTRFQSERVGFAAGYFAAMGSWIADQTGCQFLNPKPEPNETVLWTGKCKDNRGFGDGELTWLKEGMPQQKSTGSFRNGRLNGVGVTESLVNSFRAEGTFKNGRLEGIGKQTDPKGRVLEGEFKDGKLDGKGKVTTPEGLVIEGDFRDGVPNGFGKTQTKDGGKYEGMLRNGKREGYGKLVFASGNQYEGEFRDNQPHGKGKTTHSDGSTIEGDWQFGKVSGRAVVRLLNGLVMYDGEFSEGKQSGRGKKTYADGAIYEGEFKDGKEEGFGVVRYKDGRTKQVQMKDGAVK